jgi:hypothetical protein
MAAIIGAASKQILSLKWEDYRGQTLTKRYDVLGSITDAAITALVDAFDAVSNARIVQAFLESVRPITGTKGLALNALERNESEQMELAFLGIDAVTGSTVTKTIIIPALVASIELIDGSPDPASTALNTLVAALAADLIFQKADKTYSGAASLTYAPSESHHITVADVIDTI